MTNKYNFGTGRRKTSIAQVRITQGDGELVINGKKTNKENYQDSLYPLKLLNLELKYNISVIVKGGGKSSQSEAIRLGIARALAKENSDYETQLKKDKLLTRDPREKERKKPGLKRARRAPQWAKR